MHKKKEKKRAGGLLISHSLRLRIVITAMVILVAAAVIFVVNSIRMQLYEQRVYTMHQTTEKAVQLMNNVIDNEWDRLIYISHELSRVPQATREDLLGRLSDFYNIDTLQNSWKVSCIDSNGNMYCWDGRTDRWSFSDMLLDGHSDYQITISEDRDSDDEQMVFIYCMPETIRLTEENVVLTHAVLSLDMATFGEALEVSAFDRSSFSYITERNGTRLYHQQNQVEFIAAYNILTALQNTEFLYGESYDKLKTASDAGIPYTAEIKRLGESYFVSYSPLSVNNWSLFLFVPEKNVSGNTSNFISLMLLQVSMIALLMIVLIATFIWTNSNQTLKKQKAAIAEMKRLDGAKSDFISHMSHDMRTPLNGVIGMCRIAAKHIGDDATVSDCLEKIDLSSHQLLLLINDVLNMSRIEQDKVVINRETVDLHALLRICTIYIEVTVNENGILFEQDLSGISHPFIFADPVLIEKILTNILGNAAKFTPPGGHIKLHVSETEAEPGRGLYKFEIEDSGVGIKPEFMPHIFEPFSQENTGIRTKYEGTGLGLSIVKSLVDKLGGSISVQSTVGQGSTFTITLPIDYADAADLPSENEAVGTFDGSGLKVLLVEDNELNRLIAKNIMEECHFAVDTASDGAAAVELFKRSVPGYYDLIFMDVRMPVMDGLEACRCIRALLRSDASTVPIIALTADALAGDNEKIRLAGMNAHLGKPIDLKEFYAVLGKYCSDGQKRGGGGTLKGSFNVL